ncbi:MAG: crossover junction endodeoxyribonuclease RuvC [Christensenellales bacterium]|jgi:crossover junction endodeoxyribonuclease RuvC|nr:crossover junction endodeoxyribonuclease RuvC [Clostridiales bacterium]
MVILGIDPGYATVGYGIIDSTGSNNKVIDYGVITTPKEQKLPARLKHISECVKELIAKHKPNAICVEELFFQSNRKTAIFVAEARGAIILSCMDSDIAMYEYTPLQIKQAITGYGRADKNQIQQMVKVMLGLKSAPKPDDAADALAVALTHAQTNKLAHLFNM